MAIVEKELKKIKKIGEVLFDFLVKHIILPLRSPLLTF